MRPDHDLLAAYCDGVSELTASERKRVEALLAESSDLRADETATRSVLGALRDLPPEGVEPDWRAMEHAIRDRVGPDVPRSWFRAWWRWLVPATVLATAVTVVVLVVNREPALETPEVALHDAGVPLLEEDVVEDDVAIALDGEEMVLEADDDELFEVDDILLGEGNPRLPGLLTSDDLAWIDDLDDTDAAIANEWLDETSTNVVERTKG